MENLSKDKNILKKILHLLCPHNYTFDIVYTKKHFGDCRGIKEINCDKEMRWHDGRTCKWCGKQQYSVLNWIDIDYKNIITEEKDEV